MLLELVKRLISFKSISPADDSSIIFLKSYLDNLGFYTKIIKSSGISNLFACTNDNQNVDICFAGHIDVVPHGDLSNWHYDPFSAEIVDDIIYGRGIVDMKAAIACFIVAVQEYLNKKNSNINIGIIITSDEELDSQNGMIPVIDYLNENNYKIKNCIVGEPTCK
jgi:succinyl-diaminopimelate desuccinylase